MLYNKGMLGLKVCFGFWVNEATSLGSPGEISRYLVILRKSFRRKTLSWCSKLLTQNRQMRLFNRRIQIRSDSPIRFWNRMSDRTKSELPNVLSYPIIKNRVYRRALQIVQWKGILEELFSVSAIVVDPWCWLVLFVQWRMRMYVSGPGHRYTHRNVSYHRTFHNLIRI
jgi:hypothetical protein